MQGKHRTASRDRYGLRAGTLGALAASLTLGCSGGGGGGNGLGEDPLLDVTIGAGVPLAAGESTAIAPGGVVTRLQTQLANMSEFVLRATLPVPPNTYMAGDANSPLTILDYDGTPLPTQIDVVSRYADDSLGADVVELSARVRKDPLLNQHDEAFYDVVDATSPQASPGSPGLEDLRNGPIGVAAGTQALLTDSTSIRIRARDCFGNVYECLPLQSADATPRLERYGVARTTLRTYQTMTPVTPVGGATATLPHLFGVHAYISTLAGSDTILFDVRFHNGHAGLDSGDDKDDPLDTVYFSELEVVVPAGWKVQQMSEDPMYGTQYSEGGTRVQPLVEPMGDGSMHVIRWQGQFHRRLAISPDASVEGFRYLSLAGQAFCTRGTDGPGGHKYWSWWHRGVARYFPQCTQLPSFDHLGVSGVRSDVSADLNQAENALLNGTTEDNYPIATTNLGWGHPYGVAYGGMTSGNEINPVDGHRVAYAAHRRGLEWFYIVHRMHTDRQPTAFYRLDGDPTRVEDWLVTVGGGMDYVPFAHFITPDLDPGDPFGYDQASQAQIDHVRASALDPPYEADHFRWDPHDYQHYIRYTRAPKVLAWLANDPLAKDDLRMAAENFRLSYHQYRNTPFGGVQGSGLRSDRIYTDLMPATGVPFGRGESWGVDCNSAYYRLADDAHRARVRPWFDYVAQMLNDAQTSCTGFTQATVSNKFVGGKYRARQTIEHAITDNMILGVIESVYRGEDAGYTALLTDVLQMSTIALISPMTWFPGHHSPWTYTAIAPANLNLPLYCAPNELPGDAWTPQYEGFLNWGSLAYGREFVGDEIFLDKALLQIGGSDLRSRLENDGYEAIYQRASLLALVQFLDGDL